MATYVDDKKQSPDYAAEGGLEGGAESDPEIDIHTLTTLIQEGENPCNPVL